MWGVQIGPIEFDLKVHSGFWLNFVKIKFILLKQKKMPFSIRMRQGKAFF